MPTLERRPTPEELARLRADAFNRHVRPNLRRDGGKFVAIDVGTGDYELDQDDPVLVPGAARPR